MAELIASRVRSAAMLVLLPTVVFVLVILRICVLCVRRGVCYRLCSPSTVDEREMLTEEDPATEMANPAA